MPVGKERSLIACIGCGALVPDVEGPTHAYIGASPGCWATYGEVLAKEFGEFGNPAAHRLSVDAYAVQHPGVPERRARQSVAVHLMSLCLIFEGGLSPGRATRALPYFTHREYPWLDPPGFEGALTVLDVRDAGTLAEHAERVERWARSAWEAWSAHHETVRQWVERGGPHR